MIFTILRRLTHSELGMFYSYRRLKKEGSKQRAINFDGKVVDRVFPSANDTDQIFINCRFQESASTVIQIHQWLKRQDKNWRLEGNCPKSNFYDFVSPGCLFAMNVDASNSPAVASWIVITEDHNAHAEILESAESGGLVKEGMIALYGDECQQIRSVLNNHYPELFPKEEVVSPPPATTGFEPHPLGTFNILASAGHDMPSAIADLIDNSISAGATEIAVTFPSANDGGRWLCVTDNGKGMTLKELQRAMTIGDQRDYESKDLGRFGFGLKGASFSQADTLSVVTKVNDGEQTITWDKEHLKKIGRWEPLRDPVADQYKVATSIAGASGTAILLTKMRPPAEIQTVRDVNPYLVEVASLKNHLGLVFHRFLTGDAKGRTKISILVNADPVVPNDPVQHPLSRKQNPRSIQLAYTTLTLQSHILPTEEQMRVHAGDELAFRKEKDRLSLGGRMNENQGLYFYRLDRLIKWGGWHGVFAEDEHTKLLRVTVDFDRSADELMRVTIAKNEVKLSVKLCEAIKEAVKDGRTTARTRYDGKDDVNSLSARPNRIKHAPTPPSTDGVTQVPGSTLPIAITKPRPGNAAGQVAFRVVTSDKRWQLSKDFVGGRIVQISENIMCLAVLAKAIDGNPEAKRALADFLTYLDLQTNA